MRANPGGEIAPQEVIGRDPLIALLWKILEKRSIVLSAERRTGKTCVIKKMKLAPPAGCRAEYWDLEGIHSPEEFALTVYDKLKERLPKGARASQELLGLLEKAGGSSALGIRLPERERDWKQLLTTTLKNISEQPGQTILFWDELPMMLDNLEPKAAMAVLDQLRSLRQEHPRIRMVFTGSIGLHLVVRRLRDVGYVNDPTNDMEKMEVPPLELDGTAQELTRKLIEGEQLPTTDDDTIDALARSVDGIPYFIHHIVEKLTFTGRPVTTESIDTIISDGIHGGHDNWNLSHYRDRLDNYYLEQERTLALPTLDTLAIASMPLPFPELLNCVKARVATEDEEAFRSTLTLLQRDHYVSRQGDGYRFRFSLIRRWWRHHRDL